MPSWEEAHAASISAFRSVASDIGNTYQQVLYGESGVRQNMNRDLAQGTMNLDQVSPEYQKMELAYQAQEQEREYWDGITVDDYQPTDMDWDAYGKVLAEQNAEYWEGKKMEAEQKMENSYSGVTGPDRRGLDFDM